MKLSFVIPVYNAEKYLNQCVDSILNSKSQDIEIVLIDDGSTDKSSEICDEYSKKSKVVKTIHQKNSGVASARNTGIKESSGDYIFFVDNDDWVATEKLNNLIQLLKKNNVDLVINRYLIVDGKKESLGNNFINKKNIDNKNTKGVLDYFRENRINIMAPWEYVVKKEVIVKNNLSFNSNQNGADDSCFSPILFCNCNSFHLNEDVIYFWRQRLDSQGKIQEKHELMIKNISVIESLSNYLSILNDEFKINYIYFTIYKNICALFNQYYEYSNEDRLILDTWYKKNVNLIKLSIKQSGFFHRVLNLLFGNLNGIILSYKFAVMKGWIYLNFYKNKK